MDPKWLIVKVLACKGYSDRWDAMVGRIGAITQHLRSLLDDIELIILCAFVLSLAK